MYHSLNLAEILTSMLHSEVESKNMSRQGRREQQYGEVIRVKGSSYLVSCPESPEKRKEGLVF